MLLRNLLVYFCVGESLADFVFGLYFCFQCGIKPSLSFFLCSMERGFDDTSLLVSLGAVGGNVEIAAKICVVLFRPK